MGQLQFGAMLTLAALSTCLVAVSGFPRPQGPGPAGPLPIPRPGSDGSYAGDNHFQYINVPAHKTFEWGYRRGNPHHNREEYLSQKDHTFKAKLKWSDEYCLGAMGIKLAKAMGNDVLAISTSPSKEAMAKEK